MTPKEKARELVNEFYTKMNPDAPDCNISYRQAKQCELIVVNEILLGHMLNPRVKYWNEVKQEILKL